LAAPLSIQQRIAFFSAAVKLPFIGMCPDATADLISARALKICVYELKTPGPLPLPFPWQVEFVAHEAWKIGSTFVEKDFAGPLQSGEKSECSFLHAHKKPSTVTIIRDLFIKLLLEKFMDHSRFF
jgi:hypothetical protein